MSKKKKASKLLMGLVIGSAVGSVVGASMADKKVRNKIKSQVIKTTQLVTKKKKTIWHKLHNFFHAKKK